MKQYKKQNKIQKEALNFIDLFRKDHNKIRSLEDRGIKTYTPKVNKVKLSFISVCVVGCLATPCTNWIIIPLIRWSFK